MGFVPDSSSCTAIRCRTAAKCKPKPSSTVVYGCRQCCNCQVRRVPEGKPPEHLFHCWRRGTIREVARRYNRVTIAKPVSKMVLQRRHRCEVDFVELCPAAERVAAARHGWWRWRRWAVCWEQRSHARHLFRSEVEAEDVHILCLVRWVCCHWNHRNALLDIPTQHCLRCRDVVCCSDALNRWIREGLSCLSIAAERAPSVYQHVVCLAPRQQRRKGLCVRVGYEWVPRSQDPRVELNLVGCRQRQACRHYESSKCATAYIRINK